VFREYRWLWQTIKLVQRISQIKRKGTPAVGT
jgi:hypothetical protein